MAFASRRCLTTVTRHGASFLSNLQRLKPPTASRSLCHSSLIERDWADPTQLIPPYDRKMEREKAIMGYRFSEPFKEEPWLLNSREYQEYWELKEKKKEEKRQKFLKERRQSSFKPSVLFYVGKQPYEALRGDVIYTERLNFVNVKDKVYFVKVALLSLNKHRLIIRQKDRQLLKRAYVETVIEDHMQLFGKDLTKLRVLDFGLANKLGFNLV